MATVEFAVAMMAALIVLALMLFAVGVGVAYAKTQEAARVGARALARGEADIDAREAAARNAPGSQVRIYCEGRDITVDVALAVKLPVAGLAIPGMIVRSSSYAAAEQVADSR